MKTPVRHSSFSSKRDAFALQAAEFARDAAQAIEGRLSGYTHVLERYSARGVAGSTIRIPQRVTRPTCVLLANIRTVNDPTSPSSFSGVALNFTFDGSVITTFEPASLTANTLYNLTFLVLE